MPWYEEFDRKVREYLPDLALRQEEPMREHCSFRVGGPARRMAFPGTGEQLVILLQLAEDCGARPLVLGKGSNILPPDGGMDRLVIETSRLAALEAGEDGAILAEAGVPLARLAEFAAQRGLAGLAFAHGIPGTVGGALCMNAGAYGGEMAQVIDSVTVLFPDEGIKTLSCADMAFGYRHSLLMEYPGAVVLHAEFALEKDDSAAIRSRMDDLMSRRRASQPLEYPSAGSTFKRPEGHFAGRLIEEAGCKGLTVGGAQVSEKHAGFVINVGGATCADVLALMAEVQRRVKERSGVTLEPEVRVVD